MSFFCVRATWSLFIRLCLASLFGFVFALSLAHRGNAQDISLISDDETENLLRTYATPLFQVAGLDPDSIRIFLVKDPALNAFVTAGNQMFINTGLLMKARSPSEVIGVIAHETGHIAAGHVSLRAEAMENSILIALASTLAGVGLAVATGDFDAIGVFSFAGASAGLANTLSYSRQQEAAADQAAVRYLDLTQQSPVGLRDFMSKLLGKEILLSKNQDPYLRTHPLTRDRVKFLDDQTHRSAWTDHPLPAELIQRHARVRAKLGAFLNPPHETLRHWSQDNNSLPARYARSIAWYRDNQADKALKELERLIAEHPNDPYFHELKGQILFEFGQGRDAIAPLEKAVALLPTGDAIRFLLIRVLSADDTAQNNERAMEQLGIALQRQPDHPGLWRQAAILYGRAGNKGMTALALAERALALGNFEEAISYGTRAIKGLDPGTPAHLRSSDLVATARQKNQ